MKPRMKQPNVNELECEWCLSACSAEEGRYTKVFERGIGESVINSLGSGLDVDASTTWEWVCSECLELIEVAKPLALQIALEAAGMAGG